MDPTKKIVVTGIIAVLVGGGAGYAIGMNAADDTSSSSGDTVQSAENISVNAPAANLRVSLNNALREHVNLAGVTLRNVYTEAPDTDAAVAALDANSIEVAGLVGSVYGDEAETQFLDLWRQHIGFFADYTVAAREGNSDGMMEAKNELAGYGQAASSFFENANEYLPKDAVMPLLEEHRDMVIDVIDTMGSGDFDAAYQKLGAAADQVGEIADALAGGIEKQNPDQF